MKIKYILFAACVAPSASLCIADDTGASTGLSATDSNSSAGLEANKNHDWDFYLGLDATYAAVVIADESSNPYLLTTRAGFTIKPQVVVEAQYSVGAGSDEVFQQDVEIDNSSAIFLRLISTPLNNVTADIMLGYANTKVIVSGATVNSETFSDVAYGIGFSQYYPQHPNFALRMEFKSLYADDDLRMREFSLGFNYLF